MQLDLTNVLDFISYLVTVVGHSFMPYATALFSDNPLSNSQVMRRVQCKSCVSISSKQACACVKVLYVTPSA